MQEEVFKILMPIIEANLGDKKTVTITLDQLVEMTIATVQRNSLVTAWKAMKQPDAWNLGMEAERVLGLTKEEA